MKRTTFLAAVLATTLAWATPSAADTIQFDPNGALAGGGTLNVNSFDWLPGNALLIETLAPTATTAGFGQILFQANLNTAPTTTGAFSNGSLGDGSWITIVAVVNVTLEAIGDPSLANTEITATGGTLRIYADNERGNDLTGLGFAAGTDAGAIEILVATITGGGGTFDADPLTSVAPLDGFTSAFFDEPDGNNYPGVFTVAGRGGSDINALVTSVNTNYFLNLTAGSSIAMTNTSTIDPYNSANPSDRFSTDTIQNGNLAGVISGGLICGPGPLCVNGTDTLAPTYIIAQADANTTITRAPGVVPEPATLTLLGLGLVGAAAVRRRRASK